MKSKECPRCGERKKMDGFYKHPQMKDGYLSFCKDCKREDVRRHRTQNIDKIREYDRKRGRTDERKQMNRERGRKYYEKKRETILRSKREWDQRNQEKKACHRLVQGAIKRGELVRQPCENCGVENNIHAHHENYYKPLEVTWLCIKCHGARHRIYK